MTVQADRAQYDDRTKAAILSGNVRWAEPQDGALGETEKIEFDPGKRILRAPASIHFTRGTFDVRAAAGSYDLRNRVLSLTGPIQGSGTGQGSGGLASIQADAGEYRRGEGIVELRGRVSASSAKGDRIACDRLLLKFSPEGNRSEWARAFGSVRPGGLLDEQGLASVVRSAAGTRLDVALRAGALRLPIRIISRLWNSGSEKLISSLMTLTSIMAPPWAT